MAKSSKEKNGWPEAMASRGKVAEGEEIPANKSPGVSRTTIVQAVVIALAVLWIYRPALHGDWLWDDTLYITDNSLLRDPARLWKIWFVPGSQIEYYPIEQTIQWMQWQLWGDHTLGYHLTNLLLHFLSSLLVWRLLSKFHLRLAWLGGLIFAIHPVMVESVAWIAELKNTLSLPPFLLAMCAWIDYDERAKSSRYLLALGLFLVAMLCKTTMVMFPVMILFYAWWKRGRIGWNDVQAGTPFFLVSLVLGLTSVWQQHHVAMQDDVVALGGIFPRLARAGLSLSFYFSKCFLPVDLMPIYPRWMVDPPTFLQFLPWPIFAAATCWLWTKRRGWGRHALLGFGFFLINLAPFLGFTAGSYMAFTWVMDHFLYIPIIGLIGLTVAALGRIENQLPACFRPYGVGALIVVSALLAFASHGYAKMYINQKALWTYELQLNPEAWPAHINLGLVLCQQGHLSEAIDQYEQALQIKPDYAIAHYNLGIAQFKTGRLPEAMEQYEQALQIEPDYADAHFNLGTVLQQTGRSTEAMEQFEKVLQIDPNYAEAHCQLGIALQQTGRLPEAMEQLNRALLLKPDYAEAHNYLGLVLFQTGQVANALEQFAQALKIKPDYAEAHNNLGQSLLQLGRGAEAIEEFKAAIQLKPDYAEACYNLANALLETNQVPESIERYGQALRIKPDFTDARNNLARLQALQKTAPAKN